MRKAWRNELEEPLVKNRLSSWRTFAVCDESYREALLYDSAPSPDYPGSRSHAGCLPYEESRLDWPLALDHQGDQKRIHVVIYPDIS
ncbi:hypothetical protein TRIP_B110129 [uncultured Desulfatiglans sp.]|nr:hypothetical protein TRIP_B110129 [uncultured Desulfatiglans sp.]